MKIIDLLPPWITYPRLTRLSPGWNTGSMADDRKLFEDFFIALSLNDRAKYLKNWEESFWWPGYYDFLVKKSLGTKINIFEEMESFKNTSKERIELVLLVIRDSIDKNAQIKATSLLEDLKNNCGISLFDYKNEISELEKELL